MKLICMGDSTMQYNDETTFPQVGWPQALEELLNKDVRLMNFAKNGRSTKTFLEEGRFEDALRFTDKGSVVLQPGETVEYRWLTRAELAAFLCSGQVLDGGARRCWTAYRELGLVAGDPPPAE